jgi:hypothetical protein
LEGTVEEIVARVEAVTGLHLDPDGAVRVLTAEDWNARRAKTAGPAAP